jgi:hypothetical protein
LFEVIYSKDFANVTGKPAENRVCNTKPEVSDQLIPANRYGNSTSEMVDIMLIINQSINHSINQSINNCQLQYI